LNTLSFIKRLHVLLIGALTLAVIGATATLPATDDASRAPVQSATAAESRAGEAYGNLPLSFEANQGQADAAVKFLSRGQDYTLFLTSSEAELALRRPGSADKTQSDNAVVRMQLVGANAAAQVSGLDQLPGKSNYLIGSDRAKWRTNIPTYAHVQYTSVYPGVDLVYYGNQRQLEYDLIVAPGADPNRIALNFAGADQVSVDDRGDLVLQTRGGPVRMSQPVTYQQTAAGRTEVASQYVVNNQNVVRFALGAYDPSRALVIDPAALVYSSFLGGGQSDSANGIAVDKDGNAYVTGSTDSPDFPMVTAYDPTLGNKCCSDAFVTKLNPSGTAIVYSTYLGGGQIDAGYSIAVNFAGQAYVTGETNSSDFPVTANAYDTSYNPGAWSYPDAFVTKLNTAGNGLEYSTYLGGTDEDVGRGIAVVGDSAFVTGRTISTDFPIKNQYQADQPEADAFVAKIDTAQVGNASLVWSTYLGGDGLANAIGIAVTRIDRFTTQVAVTGLTVSTNFPTKNAFQGNQLFEDAFVTKFDGTGALLYSTYLGGGGPQDGGRGIALDSQGNAYITGMTFSNNFPITPGAFDTSCGANGQAICTAMDAFVTKLNNTGALVYSSYLGGGNGWQFGQGIAVDAQGNAYVAGSTNATDFPITPDAYDMICGTDSTCNGQQDLFLTIVNPAGSLITYSTYFGGSNFDDPGGGNMVAIDSKGGVYLAGATQSVDFPHYPANVFDSTCGTDAQCNPGNPPFCPCADAFVAKLSTAADLAIAQSDDVDPLTLSSGNTTVTYKIVVTNNGPALASVFKIQDTLTSKASFQIQSVTLDPAVPGMCFIQNAKTIACTISSLAPGASAKLWLRVKAVSLPAGSDMITGQASVASINQIDPNPANNTAVETTTVLP
jgi:uncharacterized repeat protein (TIGR01451 family)